MAIGTHKLRKDSHNIFLQNPLGNNCFHSLKILQKYNMQLRMVEALEQNITTMWEKYLVAEAGRYADAFGMKQHRYVYFISTLAWNRSPKPFKRKGMTRRREGFK